MQKIVIGLFILTGSIFPQKDIITTAHLDHLYETINVSGKEMGIIHIYAEFPDYKWISDSDEGMACVDDAARAAILYIKLYQSTNKNDYLIKAKNLINFLFYMQAENGWFYNFIWQDYSINKEFRTSVAEPNWWTWRAIWALAEGMNLFKDIDPSYYSEIKEHIKKTIIAAAGWLSAENITGDFEGYKLPLWLPYETAADQAAIILLGLSTYYNVEKDSSVFKNINHLAEGIIKMQQGSDEEFPYYAFLSWQNTWHAWGNSQAAALLTAGRILQNERYIKSAIKEVTYFYPYLIKENYLNSFEIEFSEGRTNVSDSSKYSQIAYGIRPLVAASMEAYNITTEDHFAKQAGEIACWFFGKNPAGERMYNPETGVCFDGITDDKTINKNSGAESTIECLLSLFYVSQNPVSQKILTEYIEQGIK